MVIHTLSPKKLNEKFVDKRFETYIRLKMKSTCRTGCNLEISLEPDFQFDHHGEMKEGWTRTTIVYWR